MVDDTKQPESPAPTSEVMSDTEVVDVVETAPEPVKVTKPKAKKVSAKAPTKKAKYVKSTPKKAVKKAVAKAKAKVTKPKAEKDAYGLRKGSLKSLAAAMYARKNGATLEEVKDKVGSTQLNVLTELEAAGYGVKQEKQKRKGKRDVFRYWLAEAN